MYFHFLWERTPQNKHSVTQTSLYHGFWKVTWAHCGVNKQQAFLFCRRMLIYTTYTAVIVFHLTAGRRIIKSYQAKQQVLILALASRRFFYPCRSLRCRFKMINNWWKKEKHPWLQWEKREGSFLGLNPSSEMTAVWVRPWNRKYSFSLIQTLDFCSCALKAVHLSLLPM